MYEGREMTVSKAPDSSGYIRMFDMSGVFALVAALPEAKSLRSINLQNNGLDEAAKQTITAAAGSSVQLKL